MVLNAGDSKSTFWSPGVRLFLRYKQMMFSVAGSQLSIWMGAASGVCDSLTRLDACHSSQACTSLLGFLWFCFSFFLFVKLMFPPWYSW